jgi:transposase-like protein
LAEWPGLRPLRRTEPIGLLKGKATRPGVYKCYACRKQFRVTVGTVFEASHIALRHWLQATYIMVSSKKGVSSNQLHRAMGITLKRAIVYFANTVPE